MEFALNMDWKLLREQKETLLRMIRENTDDCLDFDEVETLQGMINMIDEIQDQAVDNLDVPEKEVFPDLEE